MVKQTNKEWLEQEVNKLLPESALEQGSNWFEVYYYIHGDKTPILSYYVDGYVEDNKIEVDWSFSVKELKKLISIAEEYKTRIENDE